MSLVLEFISAFILTSAQIYAWYKISGNKFSINILSIIVALSLSLYSLINFNMINEFIKPSFILLAAIICCKALLKENILNSIIIVFCQYLLVVIYDAILTLLLLIIFSDNIDKVFSNFSGSLIVDICMCILIIFTVNLKIPNKLYYFISKHAYNLKSKQVIIFLIMVIISSVNIFALTYYNDNMVVAMVVNIIITLIYVFIVIIIIKTKNNYIAVSSKYHTSLDDLQAQESIINDYRILNHENRNNLMTIKLMTKDKRVVAYINNLLNQKEELKSKIISETLKLPEGGIRGLIYNKLLTMQENKIDYLLNVDKKIDYKILCNIDDYDIVDICQILGVFIDNAIEETFNHKNKEIGIDFTLLNRNLIISISNYYNHNVSNIVKTTKGKGRGYGLKLAKKIIDKNQNLNNVREIRKNMFIQKLYIKVK